MRIASFRFPVLALCVFVVSFVSSALAELSEASGKYYEMLRERPESGVIFDRFYDEWLGEASLDDLEAMLLQVIAVEGAKVNDFRILAQFYQRQGDEASALRVLKSALEVADASAALWLECARVEWALLGFEGAIHSLTQALELELDEDSQIEARRLLGAVYARSGELEKAQTVWTGLMEDYPGERELMEDLIELQIGEGLLPEALATAQQLVEQTREPYQRALYQLWVGEILQRKGDTESALELYTALIDRVGNGSWLEREVLAQISRMLANQSGGVNALDFFTELSARYPQRIEIRKERLSLLAGGGQIDAAVTAFQEILRLTPGDRQQREAYVSLLQRYGRLDEALRELDKLCETYPGDPELYLQRVELQGRTGDEAGLKKAIEAFAQSVGTESGARLRVARLYTGFDLMAEAGGILASLAEAYPDDLEMVESYALWLYGEGDADAALNLLEDTGREQGRDGLLRVAQTMVSLGEGEMGYTLLKERFDDFGLDAIFLQQLCQLAMARDAADEALPWVRNLVLKADSPLEMSRAVQLAAQAASQAKATDALVLELQSDAESDGLGLPELCLLAELEESQGDSRASEATLGRLRAMGGAIALSEEVRLFENRRQPALAIVALRKLIELPEQNNPVNLRRLVGLLETERNWAQALEVIDNWKRISPGDPQVWLRESDLLVAAGNLELAQQQLRRAAHKFEGEADLRLRLAALFKQSQQYAEAERIYWRMYEAEETTAERLRWLHELALAARESGRVLEYSQRLEAMRQADRQSLLPLLALANLHRLNNDLGQLTSILQEAERVQPENLEVLDQLAATYESVGEYEKAEAGLQRLLRLEPTDANRRRLVNFLMRAGEQEAAFAMIKSGASGSAPDAASLESFIDLLMEGGEWELAETEALAALQQFPKDWRLGYQLAVCYAENYKDAKAIELFLELKQTAAKLDRLQTSAASTVVQSYLDDLPPKSREIAATVQKSRAVFGYQQRRSQRGTNLLNAGSQQFVYLPEDVTELHRSVTLHLGALVSAQGEASRESIIARMTAAGIPYPELFVMIEGARSNNGSWLQSFQRFMETQPENSELLPLMVQYGGSSGNEGLGKESALLGLETYGADYPRLSMQFAFQLIHLDPDNALHYVDRLIDMLGSETWTTHSRSQMIMIGQLLNLMNYGRHSIQQVELTAQQRTRLRVLAEANYQTKKLSAPNPNAAYIYQFAFQVLVALALDDTDSSAFIELLHTHLAASEATGTSRYSRAGYGYRAYGVRRGQPLDLKVPAFTPLQSGFAPDEIAILFSTEAARQRHPMSQIINPERIRQLDALEMGQHLDAFEHPRLRFLAAWRSGQAAVCVGILEELAAEDTPRMEDLKLLAQWQHSEQKDTQAALETLDHARTFASDSSDRQEIDTLIVAMALAQPEGAWSASESLKSLVASAALRLRPGARMNPHHVPVLVAAMRELGLKADADRFEESANLTMTSGLVSHTVVSNPFAAKTTDPMTQMDTFAKQGKLDAAVGIAVRILRPLISQASQNWNSLRNPVQRIEKAQLTEAVLARFASQDSRSLRRIESYAVLLDAFGRAGEAARLWQKLQTMRPTNPTYALEAAFTAAHAEGGEAIDKLLAARPYRQLDDEIGNWFVQQAQNTHEQSFDQWMRLLDMSIHVMNTVEPSADTNVNLTWAPYLAVRFAQNLRIESHQYPGLIEWREGRASNQVEDFEAQVRQRSARYEAFCRALLPHPQTAGHGFELLYLKRLAEGIDAFDDPDIAVTARAAVLLDAQYTPLLSNQNRPRQRWAFTASGRTFHSNSNNLQGMDPLVFLIRMAERGYGIDLGQLASELTAYNSALAADLEAMVGLLAAEEAQISVLLEEWVATEGSEQRMPLLFEAFRMGAVGDAALQVLLKFGQAQIAETPAFQEIDSNLCTRIALIFAELGKDELLDQWFDQIFTYYLGSRDGWADKVAAFTPGGHYNMGNANYQLSRVWQLAQGMAETRDLALPLVRYTRQNGIGLHSHAINRLRQSLDDAFTEVPEALAWVESQQLLVDFENFDPLIILDAQRLQQGLPVDGLPADRNMITYERALRNIDFKNDADEAKKKEFIFELKKRNFGGQILAAFIEGASSGRGTAVAALEPYSDRFRTLHESEQQAIAFLYKYWIKDGQSDDVDTPIVAYLQRIWQDELRTEAASYLSIDTPLTDQSYNTEQQQLRGWIASLVWEQPELAAQLYLHWLKRDSAYIPTRQRFSPNQRDSYSENILRSAFNQTRSSGQALESLNQYFAYVATNNPAGAALYPLQRIQQLRNIWERRIKEESGESNPSLEQVIATLPAVSPAEADAPERFISALGLFNYGLYEFRYNRRDADKVIETLSRENLDTSLHSKWFRASMLVRIAGESADYQTVAKEAFVPILTDEEVPLEIRLALFMTAQQRSSSNWLYQPALAEPSSALLLAYLDAGFPIFDNDWSETLKRMRPAFEQPEWKAPLQVVLSQLVAYMPAQVYVQDKKPAESVIDTIVRMALELDELPTALKVINQHINLVLGDSRILFATLSAGLIDTAFRLTPPDGSFDVNGGMRYTAELHAQLPDYLAKVANPAARYNLAVQLGSLEDASELSVSGAPDRAERSTALLRDFGAHKNGPRPIEQLKDLCKYASDLSGAIPYIAELVGDRNFGDLVKASKEGNSDERRQARDRLELYKHMITAELAQGSTGDLIARMGLTPGEAYESDVWSFLRELQRSASEDFLNGLETYNRSDFSGRLPSSKALMELFFQSDKMQSNNESKQAYYIYLIAHIGAGSADEIETDLSSISLKNLAELKKQSDNPESLLRQIIYWVGTKDEQTDRRRAALRILLSDHARLDELWSTSPKALSDALRGSNGSERARDLGMVLPSLNTSTHQRAEWIQLLLGQEMLDQKDADVAHLIRLFAPGVAGIFNPSDLLNYQRKFAERWKDQVLDTYETSTKLDAAWLRMDEVIDQLETDAERNWAASTLYYFTSNERALNKVTESDQPWVNEQVRSNSVARRLSLLGVLYRAQVNEDSLPTSLKNSLMSILDDTSLPFYLRYQASQDVVRARYYKDLDDDIYRAVLALLKEYLESGYDLYDGTPEKTFEMFYRKELDETTIPDIRRTLQAWNKAVITDDGSNSTGSGYSTVRTLSLLSLKLGETEPVPALASLIKSPNWTNIDFFMWLIRQEMYDLGQTLLKKRDMLGNRYYSYGYDAMLDATLPAFIERYETFEARYRTEVIFASVVDSQQYPLPSHLPDRQARCLDLLARFEAHSNDPDADKMLDLITPDEVAELQAEAFIARFCEELSMQTICEQLKANKFNYNELSLYVKHLSNHARSGQLDFVRAELEVLASFDLDGRQYQRLRSSFEDLLHNLNRSFIDDAIIGQPTRIQEWLALAETLCKVYQEPEMTYRGRNQRRVYLLYQLARQAAAAVTSVQDEFLESSAYIALDTYFKSSGMRNLVNLDDALGWGETEKERQRLFTALRLLLQNEAFLDQWWLDDSAQLAGGLRFKTEFEQAALLKILPERIAVGTAYEPWLAFILAENCYSPQESTEEAIQWYLRARETALASEVDKFRTTAGDATLRLAALWQDQPGGADRALKLLDSTPLQAYSKDALAEVEALRAKLGTGNQ